MYHGTTMGSRRSIASQKVLTMDFGIPTCAQLLHLLKRGPVKAQPCIVLPTQWVKVGAERRKVQGLGRCCGARLCCQDRLTGELLLLLAWERKRRDHPPRDIDRILVISYSVMF